MSDAPPQLRDQAGVRSGLRIGGAIVAASGLILIIVGFASFFSGFGSVGPSSMAPPKHFWMLFAGMPLLFVGVAMLGWGFVGTTTRYAAGEVSPTVKDTLGYVGIGAKRAVCAKCGESNPVDAKFCDHCGAALSISCPSCGHANAADSAFCSECGKPLTAA
jgi:double zinc ribbon protein